MLSNNSTIIVADDLTGANDTALQFFKNGLSTRIIIDYTQDFSKTDKVDVWAISTESRNVDRVLAHQTVSNIVTKLKNTLNIDNFYKKIDSTLRGRTGIEIATMLDVTKKDAAVIVPAYIEEGRTTIGGYQLLNGVVIERTQCALDPKAPIYESYIPDILKKDANNYLDDLIDTIGLKTVTKGAGPINLKISDLIQKGKKLIVIDAMSNTDLEQIALAINKSTYDILPCGCAGLAGAINKIVNDEKDFKKTVFEYNLPKLPRLVVSGSATHLTLSQIEKLKQEAKHICFIDLTIKDIISGLNTETTEYITENLKKGLDVVVHSSYINKEMSDDEASGQLIDVGIAKDEFPSRITNFLSELVYEVNSKIKSVLIIVGGETSFKCASKISSTYLEILDAIMPAIPLCKDINGNIIVTKSGNFGTTTTLLDIINYFNRHNEDL